MAFGSNIQSIIYYLKTLVLRMITYSSCFGIGFGDNQRLLRSCILCYFECVVFDFFALLFCFFPYYLWKKGAERVDVNQKVVGDILLYNAIISYYSHICKTHSHHTQQTHRHTDTHTYIYVCIYIYIYIA